VKPVNTTGRRARIWQACRLQRDREATVTHRARNDCAAGLVDDRRKARASLIGCRVAAPGRSLVASPSSAESAAPTACGRRHGVGEYCRAPLGVKGSHRQGSSEECDAQTRWTFEREAGIVSERARANCPTLAHRKACRVPRDGVRVAVHESPHSVVNPQRAHVAAPQHRPVGRAVG